MTHWRTWTKSSKEDEEAVICFDALIPPSNGKASGRQKKIRSNNDIPLVTVALEPKKTKPEHSIKSIRRIALVRYFYALI